MDSYLVIIQGFILFSAILTIVGITTYDISLVRTEAKMRRKRRRERKPLVSIVVDDDVSKETIKNLRKCDYRKKEIIFTGEEPRGDLILYLPPGNTLGSAAISRAVYAFLADPNLSAGELIPIINNPKTFREFLCMYQNLSLAPFSYVRIAYRITTHRSRWPLMIRPGSPRHSLRTRSYRLIRWLSALFNAILFAYVIFLALWLYEPLFLFAYIGFFAIWIVTAIWHYENFSLRQKAIYILLAPASLGYFAVLTFIVPIRPMFRIVSHLAAVLSLRAFRQHAA